MGNLNLHQWSCSSQPQWFNSLLTDALTKDVLIPWLDGTSFVLFREVQMQERTFKIEYQVSNTWKLFTQTHNESSAIYIARDLAKSVQGLRVINPIGETIHLSE